MEIIHQFGDWKVLEPQKIISYKYYECQCKCGIIKQVRGDGLIKGRSSRCENCRKENKYIDPNEYIGKRFGKRVVTKEGPLTKFQQRTVICKCECGLETIVVLSRLKILKPKACQKCNTTKHGYEGTTTYNTWRTMKYRCYNTNHHNYKDYGARGIKICEMWLESFQNFLNDMGEKPKGKQIDRINNDGNYEPGNCRWVTPKENSQNRRKRPVVWNLKKNTKC